MSICKGITLSGVGCKRRIKNQQFCYQHKTVYRQSKPAECIVCCESLANQRKALDCGHWIHTRCVVESAKAECPICRAKLSFSDRVNKRIEQLAKERRAEYLAQDEEQIYNSQYQVPDLIGDIFQEAIGELLSNEIVASELFAGDVILDDGTYQGMLQILLGQDRWTPILESDMETD